MTIRALVQKYTVTCHVTLYRFIKKLKAGNTSAKGYCCVNREFTPKEETVHKKGQALILTDTHEKSAIEKNITKES